MDQGSCKSTGFALYARYVEEERKKEAVALKVMIAAHGLIVPRNLTLSLVDTFSNNNTDD